MVYLANESPYCILLAMSSAAHLRDISHKSHIAGTAHNMLLIVTYVFYSAALWLIRNREYEFCAVRLFSGCHIQEHEAINMGDKNDQDPLLALPARCDRDHKTQPDTQIQQEVNQWSGPVPVTAQTASQDIEKLWQNKKGQTCMHVLDCVVPIWIVVWIQQSHTERREIRCNHPVAFLISALQTNCCV